MRKLVLNICIILVAFLFIYMGCRDINPVASTEESVPTIESVRPAEAPFGATVQIGGEGFGNSLSGQKLYFNNTLAQIQALNDTSIRTRVPFEATSGPIMVIINSGDTLSGPPFKVDSTKNLFLNIDFIDPVKGRAGDEVQIFGNGFNPNPEMNKILFNDVETPVASANDTMLTTIVSPEVETGPVSVVVAQDTAVGPVFTVQKLSIAGIAPDSGPVGTAVTILGRGFGSTISKNTVTFAGVEAPIETASETELIAIVPDGAQTGPVAVTVGDITVEGPLFTIKTDQTPRSLRVITETTNPPVGFDGYRLFVDGKEAGFINPNGGKIIRDILSDQVDVELSSIPEACNLMGQNPRTVALEGQTNTTTFSIECSLPAPQISSIIPESGSVSTEVTINGKNFSATPSENIITFNGTKAPVNSATTTELITEVPDGATNGPIEVVVNGQTAEGPTFTVVADAPAISSINPQSGVLGTEVTITGENFSATPSENIITFNGTEAPVNSATITELITQVPEGATDGPVEVTVNGKTGTGPDFDVITSGTLDVVIATQGKGQDPDGYLVSVDAAEAVRTGINDTFTQSGLEAGSHQVGISDIADNCFITQDRPNPYDVSITPGQTTTTNVDIQCEAVNQPPMAEFSFSCESLRCDFDASASSDPDGVITVYNWDYGDGTNSKKLESATSHSYEVPGTYTVELTVGDNEGAENSTSRDVTVTLPEINSISPTEGPIGIEVTISGSGFSATASDNKVEFTSGNTVVQAAIKSASETQLVVDVPGDATTGPVYVSTYGYRVSGPTFTVIKPMQPKTLLVDISTEGPTGDGYTLSVTGQDARFVGPNGSVMYYNIFENEVTVELSGLGDICTVDGENPRVVNINNSDNAGYTQFNVSCQGAAPTIDSINPTSGVYGSNVQITGTNFSTVFRENNVQFNGTRAELNSVSETEIDAIVPYGATTGPVTVIVNGQTATGPEFTVITTGRLEVNISTTGTNLDPDGYGLIIDGGGAAQVNINDFVGYDDLSEGSHSIELTDIASNCFITQDRPNPYDVSITPGQTTTTNVDIQCEAVNEAPMAEFSFSCESLRCDFDASASSDPDGVITVYNWDYGDGTNSEKLESATSHSYEVPGTYTVELTVGDNEGAENSTSRDVTVTLPEINSISPTEGPIGIEVTISGSGFSATASDNKVEFTSGNTVVQAAIKSASETQLVVDVPGDATTGPVYVSTYGYRVQGPIFTVKSFAVDQPGFLEVSIVTSGSDIDSDGYILSVEGADDRFVQANAIVTYYFLFADEPQVLLSGIADNCTVGGENPRTVNLNNPDKAGFTKFNIRCVPLK